MNNDVVFIQLDRPRELRFGHKALKKMVALTGKELEGITEGNFDLEDLEKILYCGLLSNAKANNETLMLEQMEDIIDEAPSYGHVMDKLQEALEKSFGKFSGESNPGNQQAVAPNASRKK